MARLVESVIAFYNKRGTCEQGSRKAKARSNGRGCRAVPSPPTPSASSFMRSPTILGISCARWRRRSRSKTGRERKNREPRPLCRLPDSRGRCSKNAVCRDFASDRRIAAAAGYFDGVRHLHITHFEPNPWEDCVQITRKNVGVRRQTRLRRPKAAKNRPRPACGLQSSRKQEPLCRFGVYLANFGLLFLVEGVSGSRQAASCWRYGADSDLGRGQESVSGSPGAEGSRFGCRRVHILLTRESYLVNHKKLFRLYRKAEDRDHQGAGN
jgi:hypothetical protein